jgi:hypothetical protein
MIKRPTIFYLEDEVIDKLKEKDNRSAFVNETLKEALKVTELSKLTDKELDLLQKKAEAQLEFENKLKQLEQEYATQ